MGVRESILYLLEDKVESMVLEAGSDGITEG